MGRPRKEISKVDFEGLLSIQCTLAEVTAFFDHKLDGCSEDTIERWCKRTYGKNFAEISDQKRLLGRISLRRMQWEHAKKSVPMAIFLGKNYLNQSDVVVNKNIDTIEPVRIIHTDDGGIEVDE